MLKTVMLGVWVAIVTAGAAFFSATMMQVPAATDAGAESNVQLEEITTDMTSVPVVRGGTIIGYVIIQLSFQADTAKMHERKLEPRPYLIDAAFRAVYAATESDFGHMKRSELDKLTDDIKGLANQRLGEAFVHDVLIQQLNYVRKEDIRTHWIKKG